MPEWLFVKNVYTDWSYISDILQLIYTLFGYFTNIR